jgi:succinate dehydrogenase / fumarate reductase flavoprotein subunit
MARNEAGLQAALLRIPELRAEFWQNVKVTGDGQQLNPALEHAGRVADFLEFAELLCLDALTRNESCGGHFRTEFQEEGECRRDDANFAHVAAWEYQGQDRAPARHQEPLVYDEVHMSTRSYK